MSNNVDKSNDREMQVAVDIFRDTPIRYMGYSNEVGEAFRSVVDKKLVWGSYGVACAYVLADTSFKMLQVWKQNESNVRTKEALKSGADVLIWQSLASVVIPGLTINRICALTGYFLRRSTLVKMSKPLTVAAGLASIPLIIQPIDRSVDFAMDASVRKYLKS